jgi:hypothetical protein
LKLQLSFTQERIISRVCPQCGRVLEESWVSCPYCGRNLTGRQKRLGITFEIPASIASIKAKLRAVVYWSLFLFVLLASYLFSASNPHTTLYGWFIIPAVASFFVGYIVAELHTAVETILASFLLHAPIIIVLLSIPLFFNSLPSSANINWQDLSSPIWVCACSYQRGLEHRWLPNTFFSLLHIEHALKHVYIICRNDCQRSYRSERATVSRTKCHIKLNTHINQDEVNTSKGLGCQNLIISPLSHTLCVWG